MGKPRIHYIEPGDETVADRLAAARDLARCAAAADAEWHAMCCETGGDPERELSRGSSVYDHPRKPRVIDNEEHAIMREDSAKDALVLEIEALARDGMMDALIASAGRKDFAEFAEVDLTDLVR